MAATAIGVVMAAPGFLLAQIDGLKDVHLLLGVASLAIGLGGGLLALYVRKLIRDREDELRVAEEAREERLVDRLKGLEAAQVQLRELVIKMLTMHEALSKDVQRIERETERAHARLDLGRDAIAEIRTQIAAIAGGKVRPFRRQAEEDGA